MSFFSAIKNGFDKFKNVLYTEYKGSPAKMMVHTGTIGWTLSSIAQLWNIATSDKFTSDEKKFLMPQEILDAIVNIALFYTITNSCKNLSSKLVSSGKLLSKELREYVEKVPIKTALGKFDTNLANEYKNDGKFFKMYQPFKDGIDMAVNTVACIIASNIATPVFRNKIAAIQQKQAIAKEKLELNSYSKPVLPNQNNFGQDDYKRQVMFNLMIEKTNNSFKV